MKESIRRKGGVVVEQVTGARRWLLLLGCILMGVFIGVTLFAEYAVVFGPYSMFADALDPATNAPPPSDAATWLATKQQLRLVAPGRAGDQIIELAAMPTHFPDTALLPYAVIEQTVEPGGVGRDVAGVAYVDHNLWELCGPAAANNTLYFWNGKSNHWGTHSYSDPSNGVTTIWDDTHNRSYTLHLAWEIRAPGWPRAGMMDTHNPSFGVTLYGMRDALNWEASGENAADWQQYFYTNEWWNENTPEILHLEIEADIVLSSKPVVAEVDARFLPNWPDPGEQKNHYITIIGYDNATGEYAYTDTCGHTTGCGSRRDGGISYIPYSQLWLAITAIPVNHSTDPHAGDGGWVW